MRKSMYIPIVIFVVAFLFTFLLLMKVHAQDVWVTANQVTVAWDPVTTLSNGDPIPPNDTVTYNVYIRNVATSTETMVGTGIVNTSYTITFSAEGKYLVGVSTVRIPEGTTEEMESVVGWSDDPAIATGGTFGVQMFLLPSNPVNLHVQ